MGTHAAASTPHLAATRAALDVMRAGGNAVDAAVAAAAVCVVVQPFTSSLAGVGWAMVHDPAEGTAVLEFTGAVPAALPLGELHADAAGLVDRPRLEREGKVLLGALTPSLVSGWAELLSRRGRWDLGRVLQPAIALALQGFAVSELLSETLQRNAAGLLRWPSSVEIFFTGGHPPEAGARLGQPELAATLTRVAQNGAEELRTGHTAGLLVDFFRRNGGCLTRDDLAAVQPRWLEPLTTRFRGHTVCAAGGPLGDAAFVSGLQVFDHFPPFDGPLDPAYVHASIESAQLVAHDRTRYLGAETTEEMVAWLLSDGHTQELYDAIGEHASPPAADNAESNTITLAVVDEGGGAVNLMQTVGTQFGTGAVVDGTGMLANNSACFSYPRGAGSNRIIPGRKVEQNPCLAMVLDGNDGSLRHVIGSPGGKTRVETVLWVPRMPSVEVRPPVGIRGRDRRACRRAGVSSDLGRR